MEDTPTLPETYNFAVDFVDEAPAPDDKVAFIDRTGSHTYGELRRRMNLTGSALLGLGVRPGDRVGIAMLDTFEWPAVFWGSVKAGIIPVCMNTLLTTESYDYVLRDCGARALIVSEELLAQFLPILDELPDLEHVFVAGSETAGRPSLDDLTSAGSGELAAAHTGPEDVAVLLYSSGSTGLPKGVKHKHGSFAHTVHTYSRNILDLRSDDVVYSAAKLFFAYGLGNGMTFPLKAGATSVLLAERPTPESVMEIMATHEPTVFFGVPTLYAAILADPANTPETGSSRLRMCVSAGEALPEAVGNGWEERFGVEILDGIGSTEMLHIFLSNRPGDVRYGWTGRAVPGYEARIVDEADEEVPAGEMGELLISGASASAGYWNLPEKSAQTFQGRWTRTGDKYLRDENGYFLYCGRTDDMFKSGGNWVSPFEVESAIAEHGAVLEAAVIGKADESGNLKPKAFVVLTGAGGGDAALQSALQEHVKTRLEKWKYPRWIEFVDELPKTATGKIQRYKLRELDSTP